MKMQEIRGIAKNGVLIINHPAASGRGIIRLCMHITPQAAGNKPVSD